MLTLDLFRTSHEDPNVSLTSSYLDLAPLYGSSQEEQNLVRTFRDGMLKPDCFSEDRLDAFPPGVGVLLLCFNRFHNYAVGQLASINEGYKFSMPDRVAIEKLTRAMMPKNTEVEIQAAIQTAYDAAVVKRDNDLFQTGRLYVLFKTSF
jgi:linoleate 8R-lipoxygenase / 9,12-octadecadienoate 8-hydroperoxide 8R-isomerase